MSLFFKDEPNRYEINGNQLICLFGSDDTFDTLPEQRHAPTRTILNLEWTDKAATCFICDKSGYMHWFLRE